MVAVRRTLPAHPWPATGAGAALVAAREDLPAGDRLELLERLAGADRDAGERRGGGPRRDRGLGLQALAQAGQQRAPARKQDPVGEDVGGQLGRRLVERLAHRVADLLHVLGRRGAGFVWIEQ